MSPPCGSQGRDVFDGNMIDSTECSFAIRVISELIGTFYFVLTAGLDVPGGSLLLLLRLPPLPLLPLHLLLHQLLFRSSHLHGRTQALD